MDQEPKATAVLEAIEKIAAALTLAARETERYLTLAGELPPGKDTAAAALRAAQVIGHGAQGLHGDLVRALAQAERVKVARAGLAPWIAATLGVSGGRAHNLLHAARGIGARPELAQALSSGTVGADTVQVLSRAAKAVAGSGRDPAPALTETLRIAQGQGVAAARRRVRELEQELNPASARKLLDEQRRRSFVRFAQGESGMVRIEGLVDPERATTLRATVDALVGSDFQARQFDGENLLPAWAVTTEQKQAHALVRFAEVFATATPARRAARFTPPTLYIRDLESTSGLVENAYRQMLPAGVQAPLGSKHAHLLETRGGIPVLLDGQEIDEHPTARLAGRAQRIALAYRDRGCAHPGCERPATWTLHAHHENPYSTGGPTTLENLTLLCAEHHLAAHHPE
jgi:hypothetical protein